MHARYLALAALAAGLTACGSGSSSSSTTTLEPIPPAVSLDLAPRTAAPTATTSACPTVRP